jgi:hypothetical protein
MFIQVMLEKENEEKKERMPDEQASSQTQNQPMNPNREPGGGAKGMGESKVFYNTSYGPDENPNEHLKGIHKE